jgi:hypothetical protein
MGHVTITAANLEEAKNTGREIKNLIRVEA